MKKAMKTYIIKWYEDGLTVNEIVRIIPQYCEMEIAAVIKEYRKEKECGGHLTSGSRSR